MNMVYSSTKKVERGEVSFTASHITLHVLFKS